MKFPGFSDRLRSAFRAAGYWREDRDKPHIQRFCLDKRWMSSYIYRWLEGQTPSWEQLTRLAQDLDTTVPWLLLGVSEEGSAGRDGHGDRRRPAKRASLPPRRRAIAGGSDGPEKRQSRRIMSSWWPWLWGVQEGNPLEWVDLLQAA